MYFSILNYKTTRRDSCGSGEYFKYDANGNITERSGKKFNSTFIWDEENRLRVVANDKGMQHYIYDAAGERILKANSNTEEVYENGTLVNSYVSLNCYTSYPSAFLVINGDDVYSKHYYAGSQRIASRLGDNKAYVFEDKNHEYPQEAAFDIKKLQNAQKNDLQLSADQLKKGTVVFKEYKPTQSTTQEKEINDKQEEGGAVKGDFPTEGEKVPPIYFYHPDHLGTSSALTDFNGNAYQFFLNLPFGETMAEQLGPNYYNTPFKFNGKELDEETGLYYYGARYYDPRISIWLSVDPLAEKYPNASPYIYCLNNPINAIDPDGRYFFGLFGSTASERRMARAERFATKVGGCVLINESTGRPSVNYDVQGTSDNGVSFKSESRFGDFSSWENFKNTLKGMDRALEGSSDGANKGGYYGGASGQQKFIDDSQKTSSYVKISGLAVAASALFTGPGAVPIGIAIYDAGEVMDKVSTGVNIIKDVADENYGSAGVRLLSEVATGKADGMINNTVLSKSQKLGAKAGAEVIIESTRDKVIDKINEK